MRKLLCLLAASLLTGCATIAGAGSLADVAVINRSSGERLPLYRHDGRLYVEGRAGERYAVELRNRTGARILTVLAVDGVNAITGQTAAASQSGYVLGPWNRAEIAGWRKNMSDVAAFYFTALPDSYAARTGRPDNVGVIGVAVYREYVEPPRAPLYEPQSRAEDAGRLSADEAAGAPRAPAGVVRDVGAAQEPGRRQTRHRPRRACPCAHLQHRIPARRQRAERGRSRSITTAGRTSSRWA